MPTLFQENLAVLAVRYPALAAAIPSEALAPPQSKIENLPALLASLAPGDNFVTPTLIAGLDDGRLEAKLQALPSRHPALPGFRPPIYLLCAEISQLAAVLQHQDWRKALADQRFLLFTGSDAAEQFRRALQANPRLPFPKFAINVQPGILPGSGNLDEFLKPVQDELNRRCAVLIGNYAATTSPQFDCAHRRLKRQGRLKILGLTSRYTTFLQHSMRDWLSAMRKLGHETRLLIEEADHELLNTLSHAQACADFRPDLILLIDHYRAEFPALPAQVPAVMWVQDMLPNIFNAAAGPRQTPWDFCMGYGRLKCVAEFGYPESRFMPAVVGVNEQRFAPRKLSQEERQKFACDICYVGHTGPTPEQIVRQQVDQSPAAAKLLWDIYQRLENIYAHDGFISDPLHVEQLVKQSLAALNLSMPAGDFRAIVDLFSHQVNYAFFRHQALAWLLDLDVNVHIYGQGWENHPTLKKFAKGVADNQKQLPAIYQAAKINLQITPHGIVHQRLFEGLCAGGFFLLRHRPGDVVERIHRPLWEFCAAHGIRSDADLQRAATPEIQGLLEKLRRCIRLDPFDRGFELSADLRLSADSAFAQSAGTLWPEQYDRVTFASQNELRDKVYYYLQHPEQRQTICQQMRQIVLERMTYTATSRRLLDFLHKNLPENELEMAA